MACKSLVEEEVFRSLTEVKALKQQPHVQIPPTPSGMCGTTVGAIYIYI